MLGSVGRAPREATMPDRLTVTWPRARSVAGALATLAGIALLCWRGPRLPPNPILAWRSGDAIGVMLIGAPLCLYWLASARNCRLDLSRPAGGASFATRSLLAETVEHCGLQDIVGLRIHANRSTIDGFMFETLTFVLADGRRMQASPRSWRKGGWERLAADCAQFLGGGAPVSRDEFTR